LPGPGRIQSAVYLEIKEYKGSKVETREGRESKETVLKNGA
jgi:hypothetical protein